MKIRRLLATSRPLSFSLAGLAAASALLAPAVGVAQDVTPGFPEKVIQWGVQKGETCEDIAKALYGDGRQAHLAMRYNKVVCTRGAPLREGLTLVMPARVTNIPSAVLNSMVPSVRAKAPGGGWNAASQGMPLATNANVNTLDKASASIQFIDRSKVFLAENTLVVIFGTASQSAVSKSPPPIVEVESGEVRAALAALRGDSAEIATSGGGRVSAASTDTVVAKKGKITTVSVFDGIAKLTNAGATVEVPKNFGSRFEVQKAPEPPRPLPPAPAWESQPGGFIIQSEAGPTPLEASWKPIAGARAYRIELATDSTFDQLVTREEAPADVTKFRAAGLPVGVYFMRVRAIDKEDFIGISSTVLKLSIVSTSGTINEGALEVSPYAELTLQGPPGLLLGLDSGPLVPAPKTIEVGTSRPAALHLKQDATETTLPLRYALPVVEASFEAPPATPVSDELRLQVHFAAEGAAAAAAPTLSVYREGASEPETVALTPANPGHFTATIADRKSLAKVFVVDRFGAPLAEVKAPPEPQKPPPPPAPVLPMPRIGLAAQPYGPNPYVVDWLAPTGANAGSLSFALESDFEGGDIDGQGRLQGSGAIGPVTIDGAIFTDDLTSGAQSNEAGWIGARARIVRLGQAEFEFAPVARLGLGLNSGTPVGVAGLALGGAKNGWTWLANVMFQFREEVAYPYVPSAVFGATVDATSWLRPFMTVDVFGAKVRSEPSVGGGLTAGLEAGHYVFGTAALRVSPFDAPLGGIGGSFSVGIRQEP